MASATWSKLGTLALALFLLARASSAFVPPSGGASGGAGNGGAIRSSRRVVPTRPSSVVASAKKRDNCPGKTAFDRRSNVAGIGGLNFGGGGKTTKAAASTPRKGAPEKNARGGRNFGGVGGKAKAAAPKGVAPKAKGNAKYAAKSTLANNAPADLDWGKIAVAFLTPWRNPNSIFLYMLLLLTVLGKVNEQ